MRKVTTFVRYLALVELRATFPYVPHRNRLRKVFYTLGILLWILWVAHWSYTTFRDVNETLIDSGQVSFIDILDFRLFVVFLGISSLSIGMFLQRLFWDKDITFLRCLPISIPVLITGLLSRSVIVILGLLICINPYLTSLISRSPTMAYLPASLVALVLCCLLSFLLILLCLSMCWPLLRCLSRAWLYLLQFTFGGLLGMMGFIGFQAWEMLAYTKLTNAYHWVSEHRSFLPTYVVSEFVHAIIEGHVLRGGFFFLITIVVVCVFALLTYQVLRKNVRFPFYSQNEHTPPSYRFSRRTDRLLSFLPMKVRELVLKDLRYLYRSQRDILEGAVQMIFATAFLLFVTYTGYHSNHKELLETGPVMVAMILSLFGMRTITFQTCFDDRQLRYLLFRACSPTTFLHWKWASSFGVMFIRIMIVLGIVELITSIFFPFDLHSFNRGLFVAVLYSALFSLLGLNVTFRYLRRDSARLSLSGWIVHTLTTSLVLGIGIVYFLTLPMVRDIPLLQIISLFPLIGVILAIYLFANRGVKRFIYEEP